MEQTDITITTMKYTYKIVIGVSLNEPHFVQSQLNEQTNEHLYIERRILGSNSAVSFLNVLCNNML